MKNLLVSTALIVGLALTSFSVLPNDGVKKIGANSYQVTDDSKISNADREYLASTLAKHYNIKDWKTTERAALKSKPSARGWWIIKEKAWRNVVEKEVVTGDLKKLTTKDAKVVKKLQATLAKYE